MDLSVEIYELTKQFPREEMYSLTDQIRRAAVSVPSNIAEGHDRNTPKDTKNFYFIAYGSLAEVETQLEIANRLGYINEDEVAHINHHIYEVRKMLWSLINHIQPL